MVRTLPVGEATIPLPKKTRSHFIGLFGNCCNLYKVYNASTLITKCLASVHSVLFGSKAAFNKLCVSGSRPTIYFR